jgi:hypothetical protein
MSCGLPAASFAVTRSEPEMKYAVFGDAGLRVERYSVATDHEIFNAVGVEDGQEFFEVWVHPGTRPSSHKRQE